MSMVKSFVARHKWTIAWSIVIIVLSFIRLPERTGPELIPYADKIVHLVLYFVLGLLLSKEGGDLRIAVVYIILLGALIEVGQQEFTTYRTGDYVDFLMDLVGGYLGLYFKDVVNLIK